jgi:hypothetical protein
MVRRIDRVVRSETGGYWYLAVCGHSITAVDYDPRVGCKAVVFCPTCWSAEQFRPVGDGGAA